MEKQPSRRKTKKRKLTAAAKMAYARAAAIAVGSLGALAVIISGGASLISKILPAEAVVQPPAAIVKVLSGNELADVLGTRITALSMTSGGTVSAVPATASSEVSASTAAASGSSAEVVAVAAFDPASVGGSGANNIPAWKAVNSDVVGWLRVPNTNINYPVVVGPNNLYYNSLGYYKEHSVNGVIWADYETKFGKRDQISQNNVMYGHNWTNYSANPKIGDANDVMFAQLTAFHHRDFAKTTPYIHYSTEGEEMVWKVFAVFYTEESFNYIASDPGAAGLQNIINEAKLRSRHKYDVDVTSSDKILTLSTCTRAYGSTSQQRFVVMARLLRANEKITDVTITDNPGHKQPKV